MLGWRYQVGLDIDVHVELQNVFAFVVDEAGNGHSHVDRVLIVFADGQLAESGSVEFAESTEMFSGINVVGIGDEIAQVAHSELKT